MRFGLIGTGYWAVDVHGAGVRATDGAELVGVWGRDPDKTRLAAERLGAEAYEDVGDLLAKVDAVTFAVPPDVQQAIAVRAAAAGKHLLLDKPLALTAEAADELVEVVDEAGVASVVLFTDRFDPALTEWFSTVSGQQGWDGGWVRQLAALDAPGNPFGHPGWRQEKGALWDTGPHALSNLTASLGPIGDVYAHPGAGDLVHLVVRHESGATSTVTITLHAPEAAEQSEVGLWGAAGRSVMPERSDSVASHSAAAVALMAAAEGMPHECDVHYGATVTRLLARAQTQLDAAAPPATDASGPTSGQGARSASDPAAGSATATA